MRLAAAILALSVLAPAAAAAPNVEIRRTSHGIPHIKAATYYRIRVTARTSRKRTIGLDRRARTCAPRRN